MRRGIVVFLENKRSLMIQFGYLYTSFKYINSKDTDLIVFGPEEALQKIPNDCIKVHCKSVDEKKWSNYRRINSIACMNSENSNILFDYDILLRSDVDTFLTPAWNSFYPHQYTVGKGGYVNNSIVKEKLINIANKFGLKHRGIHNLGSSHYGSTKIIRDVYQLALKIADYLINVEFRDSPGKWPSWYKGVSIMYSCEIAVNHLIDNFNLDYANLDYPSTSKDSIQNHAHIHCWHTDKVFSKFAFETGKYNRLTTDSLDLNKVNNYCLDIALTSKKMPWSGN